MSRGQMVGLFLVLLALLCVDLRLIIWSMERPQYNPRRKKILSWRQRARITFQHWIGWEAP